MKHVSIVLALALAGLVLAPIGGSVLGDSSSALLAQGTCATNATTLCVNNDRFEITISFTTNNGDSGVGQAQKLTDDTGYFWFFDQANVEVVVKVLDGCVINGKFWVFAGGLTDVEVTMTIRDTQSGAVKTFVNPQKTPFDPVQDTSAFMTC